jgi:hypothetical protein
VKEADAAFNREVEQKAKIHAVNFAAVVLYGDPKYDEPLSKAWSQCVQSDIWRHLPQPAILPPPPPFDRFIATHLAAYLYEKWVPTLDGANDKEKFDPVFATAPPWLIWFTQADWTAQLLQFELPDLSEIKKYARPIKLLQIWPCLPQGKFDLCHGKNDRAHLDISFRDIEFYKERRDVPEELMTRLERKRFFSVGEKLGELSSKSIS